jgi:hypothetical protein
MQFFLRILSINNTLQVSMKNLLLSVCIIVLCLPVFFIRLHAQIPKLISYQGILTDRSGDPVADGVYIVTLRLYDVSTSGTPLYEEQLNVQAIGGTFNAILGRTTPLTLNFDKQYYLGITLQGQQEFAPRTILVTVPYAFNAENASVANSLSPTATGAVLSINSLQGNLQLNGAGNLNVTQSGNIITIGSTPTGIQSLASTDNAILVTNGSGPNATVTLAPVPLDKIAPSAATAGDIIRFNGTNWVTSKETTYSAGNGISIQGQSIALASQNASNGQVLKWNGTAWIPANDDNTTYTAGDGLLLTGTQLSVLPTGGDLSGLHTNATVTGIQGRKIAQTPPTNGQALLYDQASNTWIPRLVDSNPNDDITTGTSAGGDLTGTYPNPTIINGAITSDKIADNAVTSSKIANQQVTLEKISSNGAITGQTLIFNGATLAWGNPVIGGTAGGDLTGTYPNPTVANNAITTNKILDANVTTPKLADAAITPIKLSSTGATTGQALTFDGTNIVWGAPALSGTAGGDLTGTYPNPTVANNAITTSKILDANVTTPKIADASVTTPKLADAAVTPIKLSSTGATTGQALTFDGTNIVWGAPALSGTAGGDLTGTYPNPTVANNAITTSKILDANVTTPKLADAAVTTPKLADAAVTTAKISSTGATTGQALTFDGTNIVWGAPALSGTAGGDLTGTYPNPTVANNAITTSKILDANVTTPKLADAAVTTPKLADAAITPIKLSSTGATTGQALTFNGTNIVWGAPAVSGTAGGDLTGTYPNPTVANNAITTNKILDANVTTTKIADASVTTPKIADAAVTPIKLSSTGATTGQALTFNGTNIVWGAPAVSGTAGGDLTGTYPNPTVANNAITTSKILDANVTTAKIADAAVTPIKLSSTGATTGQALTFDGTNIVWGAPALSGTAGGDLTGTYPNPTVANNAITTSKILDANVTTPKIADASVTTPKLADAAVTPIKLSSTGATTGQALTFDGTNIVWGAPALSGTAGGDLTGTYPNPTVANNAITTSKILDANVTTPKIADAAVTTPKLADAAVTPIKLSSTGATTGQALTFDGTNIVWGAPALSGTAGGDLTGTYPNPTVANNAITTSKILDANVTTPKIADASVTTPKLADAAVTPIKLSSTGATTGQALTFDGTNIVWGAPALSGTAGGDLTGTYPNPTVANNAITTSKILDANVTTPKIADAAITPIKLSSTGATTGQALTFDGTNIVWGAPALSGTAGGDLTGTYPNPTVANNAITTSKILDANVTTPKIADASVTTPKLADAAVTTAKISSTGATTGQALTFDGTNIVWGAPALSGTAGGDLTGTYPNPTVANNAITTSKILDANVTTAKIADASVTTPKLADAAVTPIKLSSTGATTGQALTFDGTNIVWGVPTLSGTAGGDLTGTYPNPTVANNAITTSKILDANVTTPKLADAAITPIKLSSTGATTGQALTFDGTNIVWGAPAVSGTAGGDLTGTYPNPTVANNAITTSKILDANVTTPKLADAAVTPIKLSSTGATTGQALTFDGTNIVWGVPTLSGTAGGDLTGTYPNPTVANNAITTSKILDANVTTPKIADASVTTPKLADAAVTPIKLSSTGATTGQALTFDGTNIVWGVPTLSGTAGGDLTGTYPNPTVANNAITTSKILDANVTTPKIADASVTTPKLADAAVTPIKLSSTGATTGQALTFDGTNIVWGVPTLSGTAGGDLTGTYPNPTVANNAITTSKILDANVTTPKIADASVTTPKLADAAVTTAKISSTGATTGQALTFDGTNIVWGAPALSGTAGGDLTGTYPNPTVANNAITTSKILDANVTTPKIADASVTTPKLADAAVTPIKLSSTGATTGQALTFDGTNIVWGVPTLSGTAGGDLTGTYPNPTVANNAITTSKILDANVTTPKIADASVTTPKLADAAVTTAKISSTGATTGQALTFDGTNIVWGAPALSGTAGGDLTGTYPNPTVANNAITTSKILDANVTTPKIADASVTTPKLADAAVTPIKLSSTGATTGQALTFDGTNIVWGVPTLSGTAGGDLTGTYPNPTVANNAITTSKILDANVTTPKLADAAVTTPKLADAAVTPIKLSSTGATTGQALTFDGTNIVWGTPALSGTAGGDLTGTYPNPTVANNAITTSKILDANVTTTKLADAAVTASKLNQMGAADGQVLTWNGTTWAPAAAGGAGTVTSVNVSGGTTGLTASGGPVTSSGTITLGGTLALANGGTGATTAAGARTNLGLGTLATLNTVTSAEITDGTITAADLNQMAATNGQVLTWNGTAWAPAAAGGAGTVTSVNVSGGTTGLTASGGPVTSSGTITLGGTLALANGGTGATTAAGARTNLGLGTLATLNTVTSAEITDGTITAADLNQMGAADGQVIKWNGTTWAPANDNTGALTHFTELLQTTGAFTTTNAGVQLLANNATATNIDIALTPKGTGALTAQVADNAAAGGDKRGTYAVDWQMARANATEVASGIYSTISGGQNNTANNQYSTISGGTNNIASGTYTSIGGGESNNASDVHSTIGGGFTNTAGGEFSTVSGGNTNTANANYSSVGGGQDNTASNLHATIGGGQDNTASNAHSTIAGGENNNASGTHSTIAGGENNTANDQYSTVGGGFSNTASSFYATVAGGNTNVAGGDYSTSGGGQDNTASGTHSTISGGRNNTASGTHSTIAGGRGLTLSASGSFGFLGGNNGSNDMTIATNNTAVFGNTDLWLANNDNAASELRFYGAQSSSGAFPAGTTYYTAFRAGTQSADITYTLPTAAPTAGQILSSDASGNMNWVTSGGGLQYFMENRNIAAPNNVIPVHQFIPIGAEADIDIALTPKGTGALTAQVADDAVTGGNKRGNNAVDWQTSRTANTQVASGIYSTIAGGQNNTASDLESTVSGGNTNTASGINSTVGGGYLNTASNGYATIGGGSGNTASGDGSTISGGGNNTASGLISSIGGGDNNTASASYSVVSGGRQNQATDETATVGGGNTNIASGVSSTISGGQDNNTAGAHSTIAGGQGLTFTANAQNSFGFNGNASTGDKDITIDAANTAVFNNTDFWLTNNDNVTRSLRFYERYDMDGDFPNGTNYVGFRAPNSIVADVTWTLPNADGTNGQVLSTDGLGTLTWVTAGGGALTHFTESLQTTGAFTTTNAGVQLLANNATATNIDIALTPKGNGALTAQVADNAAAGGNKRGANAVDWQTIRNNPSQVASGNYATIAGGYRNSASGNWSFVVGQENSASGVVSTVAGGYLNTASGERATISGGGENIANNFNATVGGGSFNIASGDRSVVAGGYNNQATEYHSTVAGGAGHRVNSAGSSIGGGISNRIDGDQSVIAGGNENRIDGAFAFIGGGDDNRLDGYGGVIAGGVKDTIRSGADYSAILGGRFNTISGDYATISGGRGLTLDGNGSFGFLGNNGTGANNMTISTANTATFGNTDLWLANNDNAASELRFYEAQSSNGAFPAGTTNYTAFRAGTQSADITYTLPTAAPTAGQILSSDASGNMSWVTAGGGALTHFTESLQTTGAFTTTNAGVQLLANNATATNIDIALTPKGNGALTAQVADNAAAGGNKRGANAVDWQTIRNNPSQVASGNYATIAGGYRNSASGNWSFVVGQENSASGVVSTVAGGYLNTASGERATISGGGENIANNFNATVGGGTLNIASGDRSVVAGGYNNQATEYHSTVAGGAGHRVNSAGSSIGGGISNRIDGDQSVIAGGNENRIDGAFAFIGGGDDNRLDGYGGVIAGGVKDTIRSGADYSAILGGRFNTISGDYATISGGQNNTANGQHSFIGSGQGNTVGTDWSVIAGGNGNEVSAGNYSTIGGGSNNSVQSNESVIAGGSNNTITQDWSAILGGTGMTIDAQGSFGFLGNNSGVNNMTISTANTAVFGNTDLWLANNDNAASELRFYEAQSSSGAFPAGTTNYTAFRAGTQSADITYTLPTAAPTTDGRPLTSATDGTMSWGLRTIQLLDVAGRLW